MLKKGLLYLCAFLFILTKANAQVNLQTGSAVFSIPMFDWKDSKSRLNTTIALSYSSGSGLKVNDVASNVGQGWNLIAGGVITRLQVGEPDDQVKYDGNGSESDIRKYPDGYLFATVSPDDGCPEALAKYPIYKQKDQVYKQHNIIAEDKQLDYFSFQFNGKAGIFVLKKGENVGVSLGNSRMKISFTLGSLPPHTLVGTRTRISSFTIQDVDGLIYRFEEQGKTKVLESAYCDANLAIKHTVPKFKHNKVYFQAGFENPSFIDPWITTSWYLTEIEDPLTERKVEFNYTVHDINNIAGEDITYNWEERYALISYKTSITKTPEISSIDYPDGHDVQFNYGAERIDFKGENILSSVDVTYQGRTLSEHQFRTSYFIRNRYGTPTTDYEKTVARLCLMSVRKIGVDMKEDSPPYKFDYYMGSDESDDYVPAPFSYAKDVWGFYNGNNSKGFNDEAIDITTPVSWASSNQLEGLCFLRDGNPEIYLNPKEGYAKNGLLRQIIYPTGGTLTYDYEQNTGVLDGTSQFIGGVHVSATHSTDGGYSNGCSNPLTTQYNYILDDGTSSSLWGIEMPVNVVISNSYYKPEYKKFKWGLSCLFGCCYYKFQYPGILSQNQAVSLSDFQKFMIAASPVMGVLSAVGTIMDVVNLVCYSSGVMAWVSVILDVVSSLAGLVLTCFNNPEKNTTNKIFYNLDLNGASPLPMQFKRVEVVEGAGAIGRTVQEFTSSDDYAIWEPTNPTFSAKQRFAPWAYGLPKKTTVFDDNDQKVKETEYEYNFNLVFHGAHCMGTDSMHYDRSALLKRPIEQNSCKCFVKKTNSQRNEHWSDPDWYNDPNSYHATSYGDMDVDIYDLYTGRAELYKTYERTYKSSTDYLETVTRYIYNDENYEVSQVQTQNSDGWISTKDIYYPKDFITIHGACYTIYQTGSSNAALNALVDNNILNIPIETNVYVERSFTSGYINDQVTIYSILPNGDIKPSSILEARFDKPTNRASVWDYDSENLSYYFAQPLFNPDNPDYTFYKVAQSFTYDASGNLIEAEDEGGRSVSNIYDYDDKYIVASAINANSSTDKIAYSSFETDVLGGWTLNGTAAYINNSGVTGSRAFNLASKSFSRSSLDTQKVYTLSFWANGSVTVSAGATQIKSAPTINGFTYYEYDISQGTSSVTISGNVYIDELRLYPKAARMRTVTYDPLIGKTSECDENNQITYYEYDNLGRMRFVKDENGNAVKMYEYNNISEAKQNGCPGSYGNHLISEIFTKSGCGSGYIGSNVTYTIPANTYTSVISQEDADAKAQDDLLGNGQDYADANGSCIQLYYNTVQSLDVTRETCSPGYTGETITYSVPAERYTSTISQADADQKALDEIEANAQAYANDPANAGCTLTTDPDWEWDNESSYCLSVDGTLPPHLFVKETDVNPNSASYQLTRWSDTGPSDECPSNTYFNAEQSLLIQKDDCLSGTGNSVTYTVPAGTYSSTVSQAAADQLALDDINANGQAYANAHATCQSECTSYRITVPNSVATNLYIRVKLCGQTTTQTLNWDTQVSKDVEDDPDASIATLCLEIAPTFQYGSSGTTVSIPEITVTDEGSCP